MKPVHIIGVIAGAVIGTALAYFGRGPAELSNLFVGAVIGAVVGLFLVSSAATASSGENTGMG